MSVCVNTWIPAWLWECSEWSKDQRSSLYGKCSALTIWCLYVEKKLQWHQSFFTLYLMFAFRFWYLKSHIYHALLFLFHYVPFLFSLFLLCEMAKDFTTLQPFWITHTHTWTWCTMAEMWLYNIIMSLAQLQVHIHTGRTQRHPQPFSDNQLIITNNNRVRTYCMLLSLPSCV